MAGLIEDKMTELKMIVSWLAWLFRRKSPGMEYDDLVQEGWAALLEAEDRYDPEKASVSTWANHVIRNSLCRIVSGQKHSVGLIVDVTADVNVEQMVVWREARSKLEHLLSPAALVLLGWKMTDHPFVAAKDELCWSRRDVVMAREEIREVGKLLCLYGTIQPG